MDDALWLETACTVLATLEPALLGGTLEATVATAAAASSRKHSHRTNSETLSDIEMPGSPVKRRRESAGSVAGDSDVVRPTAKSRRLTSALSNQFARSLSVHPGVGDTGCAASSACDIDVDAVDTESPLSSVYTSSSSSPSISSIQPWPPSLGMADHALRGDMGRHQPDGSHSPADVPGGVFGRRAMKLPVHRPARAHGRAGRGLAAVQSQTSMDADIADSQSHHAGGAEAADGVFARLLLPVPLGVDIDGLHAATRDWALGQAQPPFELMAALNQRLARLHELVPAILDSMGCTGLRQPLSGDGLREFYRAAIEAADIGDWLYQQQFPLLLAAIPALGRAVPQLSGAIRVARISEDMHRLVQWVPAQMDMRLGELGSEYDELVGAKRALYGDILSQGGLAWRAMGVPIDSALLLRARQCLAALTSQCLARLSRTYERRAQSVSAYDKEEMSADSLLHTSHQVLHAAAQCAALCGDSFAEMAPLVMFIVSECATWAVNRLLPRSGAPDGAERSATRPKQPAQLRGKQLESRALRQAQACESVLKLLVYARAILAPDGTSLEAALRPRRADPATAAACRSLAASLTDLAWSLAETLTAFHADGKAANPTGAFLLFVDLVAKFGRRVADLPGSRAAQHPEIRPRLHRMQGFARGFGSQRGQI
ncbi:hypothetical protein H4R19_003566 [Coemansia spiralis]|nr:hypothetical protein H4R19_003566 [Coemansia spiralis]